MKKVIPIRILCFSVQRHAQWVPRALLGAVFIPLIAATCCLPAAARKPGAAPVNPVSLGKDGKLAYGQDEKGNRIPDFSSCGYAGGDRDIPDVPVKVVVAPMAGDETLRIQKALDYVASLPLDDHGMRGAVLLSRGRHEVHGSLRIKHSGVVLRGEGMEDGGTLLVATGPDRRTLIVVQGILDISIHTNAQWQIGGGYVPVGATQFAVADSAGLHVGDTIRIVRPSTREWIEQLGMMEFGGGIGDWRLVWHPGHYNLEWDREIVGVNGNQVVVDAPITTALDPKLGGGYVETCQWPGRIFNVGVEGMRIVSDYDPANLRDENHSWYGITFENGEDAWVRQVTFEHFAGSAVAVYETCKRMTVQDCISLAPVSEIGGWRRDTFFTMGQQTLFQCCYAEHGRHDFSAGFCAAGPNAFVQCEDLLPAAESGAMGAWSSGTLFDNVRIDGGSLSLANRGADGEGSGWSGANSVFWQCDASKIICENPPGAQNWALGCWGEFSGNGVWRDSNASVKPVSLFAAQVQDRLGADAVGRIRLMQRDFNEMSNPSQAQAAELIASSLKPAETLEQFIRKDAASHPVDTTSAGARLVDDLPGSPAPAPLKKNTVEITNGWLVVNGRLLTGSVEAVNWWRGNMRPSEAADYGVNLTRFAPGRVGPGFTDDLKSVADDMLSHHQAALDHHYGLWYDRRREDHERIRREDGDVWAPFYEQPFQRTGEGMAWDGLSLYDLTRYNPWYWSRLREFAALCDERGLLLFNENYFQHNIIEAGAHWVDCPWRTANNTNETGFPEPPPFAGDKRIFMAAQFYDVSQPVRRRLHAAFIRQNLDDFTNQSNVIQFTSAEFTGPLAFEQFWLDTVAGWENDTHRHPLIALAAPKNVQDGILSDPGRAAVVDVLCFRYWWRTDRGLFAPPGGINLSPRQFERKWHGGTPRDEDLAGMVSEYRFKFPDKVIMASGEDEGMRGLWAYLCAGGSLPDLPESTDDRLLKAVPCMTAWKAVPANHFWALRQPGAQFLVYNGSQDSVSLDLSMEKGGFQLHEVSLGTGAVSSSAQKIEAGGSLSLSRGLWWLTRNSL